MKTNASITLAPSQRLMTACASLLAVEKFITPKTNLEIKVGIAV